MTLNAILITGAAGLIGRAVCEHLRKAGKPFVGVDVMPASDCVALDLRDPDQVKRLFSQQSFRAVIHLAAILPTAAKRNPHEAHRLNVDASVSLLEEARANRVSRFVFGSSMGVYGTEYPNRGLSEQTPVAPADVYGAAKRYVEIYGENLVARKAIEFVALRIATVLGPGVRNSASPWRSQVMEPDPPDEITIPCGADSVLSLLHAEDAAAMLVTLALCERFEHSVYNTPAENMPSRVLKALYESFHPNRVIRLDEGAGRPTPPVSDGRRFDAEFPLQRPALAGRLRAAASRRTGSSPLI